MGRVTVELCLVCGHRGLERRGFCPACGVRSVTVGTVAGDGMVWSSTVIHRSPSRDAGAAEPYTVGLIALDAGPRLLARLPDGSAIGDRVAVIRTMLDGDTAVTPAKG